MKQILIMAFGLLFLLSSCKKSAPGVNSAQTNQTDQATVKKDISLAQTRKTIREYYANKYASLQKKHQPSQLFTASTLDDDEDDFTTDTDAEPLEYPQGYTPQTGSDAFLEPWWNCTSCGNYVWMTGRMNVVGWTAVKEKTGNWFVKSFVKAIDDPNANPASFAGVQHVLSDVYGWTQGVTWLEQFAEAQIVNNTTIQDGVLGKLTEDSPIGPRSSPIQKSRNFNYGDFFH